MITIKHTEYKIGDDEVILPDDDKGAAKVDEQGRLLGCESRLHQDCRYSADSMS